MADDSSGGEGLRSRLAKSSEDALGKLAQDLLENPLINGAITRAFDARQKAAQAQEAAMGALNLPSAADIERLTRRVRSVSQRLEGIEDGADRLHGRLAALGRASSKAASTAATGAGRRSIGRPSTSASRRSRSSCARSRPCSPRSPSRRR